MLEDYDFYDDQNAPFVETLRENKSLLSEDALAREIYDALCNHVWRHQATGVPYSCSWRYAGGLIASIRRQGENYLDYYCSGTDTIITDRVKDLFTSWGYQEEHYYYEFYEEITKDPLLYTTFEQVKNGIAYITQEHRANTDRGSVKHLETIDDNWTLIMYHLKDSKQHYYGVIVTTDKGYLGFRSSESAKQFIQELIDEQ